MTAVVEEKLVAVVEKMESCFVAASFLQDERIQRFVVAVEKTFEVEIEIVVVKIFDLFAAAGAVVECLSEAATAVVVVVQHFPEPEHPGSLHLTPTVAVADGNLCHRS